MNRRIISRFTVPAVAAIAALMLSVAPAGASTTAAHWYGPYQDEGTCNYWQYAVKAAGGHTHPCFYDQGWYFVED
jgi:hypothetical protein